MASTLRDSAPQVTRHLQRAFAPSQEVLGSFIGGNGPSCYLQLFCLKQCILSNAPIQLDWQIWMFNAFCTKFSLSLSLWISRHLSHSETMRNQCRKMGYKSIRWYRCSMGCTNRLRPKAAASVPHGWPRPLSATDKDLTSRFTRSVYILMARCEIVDL